MLIHDISRFIFYIIFKWFFHLKAQGIENIPKTGGFILASNHVSYLDPPAVGVSCPRRLSYMARSDLFSSPLVSWLYYRWNAFPVKRNYADLTALKEALHRVIAGGGLLLFPEGARQAAGEVGKPEPGVGFIVAKTGVPVIPVYVKGSDEALPKGAKFLKPSRITVLFGNQIFIEKSKDYEGIAKQIMESIKRLPGSF